jgi:hypothetical protein
MRGYMDEAVLLSWATNQGLAVALSCFLVWFVTWQISKTLAKIVDTMIKHDGKTELACSKMDDMDKKLDKIYDVVVGK